MICLSSSVDVHVSRRCSAVGLGLALDASQPTLSCTILWRRIPMDARWEKSPRKTACQLRRVLADEPSIDAIPSNLNMFNILAPDVADAHANSSWAARCNSSRLSGSSQSILSCPTPIVRNTLCFQLICRRQACSTDVMFSYHQYCFVSQEKRTRRIRDPTPIGRLRSPAAALPIGRCAGISR